MRPGPSFWTRGQGTQLPNPPFGFLHGMSFGTGCVEKCIIFATMHNCSSEDGGNGVDPFQGEQSSSPHGLDSPLGSGKSWQKNKDVDLETWDLG